MTFPTAAPRQGVITRVTSAAADTLILAFNNDRNGAIIYNESTAILYLNLSKSTSTVTNYSVQIAAGGNFRLERTDYCGEIRGIWAAANGAAMVTEFV